MFNHSAFRLIVMSVALTSVLVACGQQDGSNNKTIIKKSLPAPQIKTTETGEDGKTTTSTTPGANGDIGTPLNELKKDKLTASESCAKPFENFAPQDNEREVTAADLLNPDVLKLSADLKDKAVEFKLVEMKTWAKTEDLDKKTTTELAGELNANAALESQLTCHTIRTDRAATDVTSAIGTLPLVLDLSTGKIPQNLSLRLEASSSETSVQAFGKNVDADIKGLKNGSSIEGDDQITLNRVGDKHLILRRQFGSITSNGKVKTMTLTMAVYEAVEKTGAAATPTAEAETQEPASQD